jgi:hypothetical protein
MHMVLKLRARTRINSGFMDRWDRNRTCNLRLWSTRLPRQSSALVLRQVPDALLRQVSITSCDVWAMSYF